MEPLEKTTTQKLIEILTGFREWKEGTKITEETLFREELGMDSLDLSEICYKIEEELGVFIPDEEVANLRNAKDYTDYIEKSESGVTSKRRADLDAQIYDIVKD